MKRMIHVLLPALVIAGLAVIVSSCSKPLPVNQNLVKFNTDADNLITGLQQYKEFAGTYPMGDNADIAKALLGRTEKKILILAVRKSDLNNKGEICDPWGTPLQFYFSKNGVLIRSAGPNKIWEDSGNPRSDDLYRTEMPAK